jgi:hypothetical protein
MRTKDILLKQAVIRLSAIFLVLSITACTKFLDKKRSNSLNTPQTIEDLQAILDDGISMNQKMTPSYGQASSDDYFLPQLTYDARPTESQSSYTWKPFNYSNNGSGNDWARCYTAVFNANFCLEKINDIALSSQNEAKWKNVKGSALFFRSFSFLMAVWNHSKAYDESTATSDLGIALRLGSDFNVPSVRSSVKDAYDRIILDAKEAVSYLPNLPLHTYRPSKCAAYGLLARSYLSMRVYDSAFRYANLALSIKSDLINYNGDADFLGISATAPLKLFNKETIFYTEMNLALGIHTNAYAKIDTVLYSSYASNDIRKGAFFSANGGYYIFKGSYTQSIASFFTGIATDELYLICAECKARSGDKDAALTNLNNLLAKRITTASFVPVTATSAQDALSKVLVERRKELLYRGLRWIDIKRLNKEGANIIPQRLVNGQTISLQPNDNFYALPLPTDIINITGMPQNPI